MPVMGTGNVTGWMARNQACTARCVGDGEEEEQEEAESVGERREETKSERVRQGFMRTA